MTIVKPLSIVLALIFSAETLVAQDFRKSLTDSPAGGYATALNEWLTLAERGNFEAQHNLGKIYVDSIDNLGMYIVNPDKLQDNPEAKEKLGIAAKWFRLAAEQGYAKSQHSMGWIYENGLGVPRDHAEAMKWYHMAAEQGNAASQFNLGFNFSFGQGVPLDYQTAYMWYNIAAANGYRPAIQMRDSVAKNMTPASIEEAQRRSRVCMASNYQNCD